MSTMSFRKTVTSAMIAATVAVGSIVPLASAAQARDHDRDGRRGHGYEDSRRDFGRDHRRDRRHHGYRHHRKDKHGRNIAIGAFATILGLAIAAEASRDRGYGRYDY
jgi:Ni/Co efflux regulator RcnB